MIKCNIPNNSTVIVGSGGSEGFIIIHKNKSYKYFPVFEHPTFYKFIDYTIDTIRYEIIVNKLLTQNVKVGHFVKYIDYKKCKSIPKNILKECKTYNEYLLQKKSNKICDLQYQNHPTKIKQMYIMEMEYVEKTLSDELEKIAKKNIFNIFLFLSVMFFQIFYTLMSIKSVYPEYIHNDLFIRNILIKKTNYKKGTFIRYHYKKIVFDVPAHITYIKINDFGMTQLSKKISNKYKLWVNYVNNPYRDYFTIIYDVYNGANLGSNSLHSLIKNKKKLEHINYYFKNLINIKNISKIINNNKKKRLDNDWSNTLDDKVVKMLNLKTPEEYLLMYFNVFKYNPNNKIVEEYFI